MDAQEDVRKEMLKSTRRSRLKPLSDGSYGPAHDLVKCRPAISLFQRIKIISGLL